MLYTYIYVNPTVLTLFQMKEVATPLNLQSRRAVQAQWMISSSFAPPAVEVLSSPILYHLKMGLLVRNILQGTLHSKCLQKHVIVVLVSSQDLTT